MAKYETNSAFFVFRVVYNTIPGGQQQVTLIKESEPHYGHETYDLAKQWIDESDNRQVNYTILEVFRQV